MPPFFHFIRLLRQQRILRSSGSTGASGSFGSDGDSFSNQAVPPLNAQSLAVNGCTDFTACVSGEAQFGAQATNLTDSVDTSTRDTAFNRLISSKLTSQLGLKRFLLSSE